MSPWTTAAICGLVLSALLVGRMFGADISRRSFDRRCLIVNALRGGRRSTANEICQRIGVRTGTIHPDLASLMRGGLIVRELDTAPPIDRFLYRLRTDLEYPPEAVG